MKLDSLEPNAHYDMEHGMPAVLEKDNDGSVIYRVNINEEKAIPDGEAEERQIGWSCYEVRTFDKPTKANLKRVFIRSVIDENGDELFESIDDEDELQDVYEHFSVLLFDDEDED